MSREGAGAVPIALSNVLRPTSAPSTKRCFTRPLPSASVANVSDWYSSHTLFSRYRKRAAVSPSGRRTASAWTSRSPSILRVATGDVERRARRELRVEAQAARGVPAAPGVVGGRHVEIPGDRGEIAGLVPRGHGNRVAIAAPLLVVVLAVEVERRALAEVEREHRQHAHAGLVVFVAVLEPFRRRDQAVAHPAPAPERPRRVGRNPEEAQLPAPHADLVPPHGQRLLQHEVHEAARAAVAVEDARGTAQVLDPLHARELAYAPRVGAQPVPTQVVEAHNEPAREGGAALVLWDEGGRVVVRLADVDRLDLVERLALEDRHAPRRLEERGVGLRGEGGGRERLVGVRDNLHGLARDLKAAADLAGLPPAAGSGSFVFGCSVCGSLAWHKPTRVPHAHSTNAILTRPDITPSGRIVPHLQPRARGTRGGPAQFCWPRSVLLVTSEMSARS